MPPVDLQKLADGKTSVIVLGHGSRAPEAQVLLNWVADRLESRLRLPVLAASLQFNRPTLDDCCRQLVAAGAKRVVISPYFLFTGNHLQKDIPRELDRLRHEMTGTEIILADPLGADEMMVEVLLRRTLEKAGESNVGESNVGESRPARKDPLRQHPIEAESFEIIDGLLEPDDAGEPAYQVIRRVVHTTGDPSLARAILISSGAVGAGVSALAAGAGIVCDVNMVAAGIEPTAARLGLDVSCQVADPHAESLARREGITRGAAAIRMAAAGRGDLDGAVVAIGNSPTALFELLRLVSEESARPALVIGVPVGFVGAAESKERLAGSGLPHITLPGNRGGSTVAAAIANALIRLSATGSVVSFPSAKRNSET